MRGHMKQAGGRGWFRTTGLRYVEAALCSLSYTPWWIVSPAATWRLRAEHGPSYHRDRSVATGTADAATMRKGDAP